MIKTVMQTLEAHDGLCLDNKTEREQVGNALVAALTDGGMTLRDFGEALDKVSDVVDIDTFNDFVEPFVHEICRIRGWDIDEAFAAFRGTKIPEISP